MNISSVQTLTVFNQSSDTDEFYSRILKELAQELAHPLAVIFQESLHKSMLPVDWKEAQVTPLFKKGKKDVP